MDLVDLLLLEAIGLALIALCAVCLVCRPRGSAVSWRLIPGVAGAIALAVLIWGK